MDLCAMRLELFPIELFPATTEGGYVITPSVDVCVACVCCVCVCVGV